MNWKIKRFDELTGEELYEILRARAEVFVVEQNCVYQDLDKKDETAYHLWAEEAGEVCAYLRILPEGVSYAETSVGRVLTAAEHRGKGLSRALMQNALEFIEKGLKKREVRISAQAYLEKFYESFGFRPVSGVYLEDGIEHIEMLFRKEQ